MRTTIDIDDVLLKRLRDEAHSRGVAFRTLLHQVIQLGLDQPVSAADRPYQAPSVAMGMVREGTDLVKAMQLADALADEAIVQKIAQRR